jgi:hypothetical protein
VINDNTQEPPHSGSWDAWLDGYGTTHTDTLSQTVTLPAGCSTYNLSFWLHIDTAETTTTTKYDTLKVQVLNGSGTVLATLHTYSNLNHNTGYAQHSFSLSAYAGQKITLKFTGSEDYELQTPEALVPAPRSGAEPALEVASAPGLRHGSCGGTSHAAPTFAAADGYRVHSCGQYQDRRHRLGNRPVAQCTGSQWSLAA